MNPQIFREYDIRGIADEELTSPEVRELGRAMGTYLIRHESTRLLLGRDCRLSSDRIKEALLEGLLSTGAHVIDLGIVPSPVLYFALFTLDAHGGAMITGSHNPPEYNGFKVAMGKTTIHGEQIQEVREVLEAKAFEQGRGRYEVANPIPAYLDYVRENITLGPRRPHLVLDGGNGTAGPVVEPLFRSMGLEMEGLYLDMDGAFPNHHPDPTVLENLRPLQEAVRGKGAHVGLAYDGDADRLGVVDERGEVIWGDRLLIILSRALLDEVPGATIISEVKSSQTLFDDIEAHGGKAIMGRTGHSLIKAAMRETGALLAGEMSGHIFYAHRYFGYDDAIYASARLVEILSRTDAPLSELLAGVPRTFVTPEIRVPCPDDRKFAVVDRVREILARDHKVITVDGVRALFGQGWGLVRASNTQPVLVLRFEAPTERDLERIRRHVEEIIARVS